MMADHWKSIANLLGAPGVDEPEVDTPVEEAAPKAAPDSQPSATAKTPAKAASIDRDQVHRDDSTPETEHRPLEFSFDPHAPIPDEALSFKPKSSRSGNATQSDVRQQPTSIASNNSTTPPAARSFSEPSPPPAEAEARREAPRMPDRFEPETPATTPPPAPPKRKSSWESLANMFNIKVDRSKPAEAAPPVEPQFEESQFRESKSPETQPVKRSQPPTEDEQRLSIFSDHRSPKSNPALDAMFGDTPPSAASSRNSEWGKPRVIDDLGWDEDDKGVSNHEAFSANDAPRSVDAKLADQYGDGEEVGRKDEEENPRRGRRRRRGRRGRSDGGVESAGIPSNRSASDRPNVDSPRSWGGLDDLVEEDEEALAGDDLWDEPANFEIVQPDAREELDEEGDGVADELSADGEVLRRSSRRRRRGRGRGGREREPNETTETVSLRSDQDDDDFVDSPKEFESPRAAGSTRRSEGRIEGRIEGRSEGRGEGRVEGRSEDVSVEGRDPEDRGSRSRRRRRGGSSQTEKSSGEPRRETAASGRGRTPEGRVSRRPVDEEGPIEEDFDDISLGPDFDGEEDDVPTGDGKHRSIPTWADSIQSLVDANLENRKRGDNRGGAPRGRPRGRR